MRAKYLAGISVSPSYDSDASGNAHTLFRLGGSGMARGGAYRGIAGAFGTVLTGTPAGGGVGAILPSFQILTGIPVIGGNDISIDGALDGDDIGTISLNVSLLFSDSPLGRVVDFDCRTSAAQGTVNTLTAINAIIGTAEGAFRVPTYASRAQIATCTSYAAVTATTVRALSYYELTGSGFAHGGSFRWNGSGGGGSLPATNNHLMLLSPVDVFAGPVGVVGGNDITAQGSNTAEDVGNAQFGVMLLYLQ